MEESVKITGTYYSTERSTIGAQIDETISEIFADEGHRVKKGKFWQSRRRQIMF